MTYADKRSARLTLDPESCTPMWLDPREAITLPRWGTTMGRRSMSL